MPEPDSKQAEHDRADNIAARLQPFTVLHEIERLQAERGKCGVTAAQADHDELACRRAYEDAAVRSGQSREKADDERPCDIHEQGTPREGFTKQAPRIPCTNSAQRRRSR